MRKCLLLIGIVVTLSACKSYLISTVSSLNTPKDEATGIFNVENDSLKISFDFSGENTPLTVEVFNKLREPLYVNWERSALVIDDKAYSFVDDNIKIDGKTSSTSTNYYSEDTYTYGNLAATATLSKNVSFLPPNAKIYRTIYALNTIKIGNIQDTAFKKQVLNLNDGRGFLNAKSANFSAAVSPIQFRCYLTLYTLKNNQPNSFSYQQNFFVSNLTKTSTNPKKLVEYQNNPGNVIINSKTSGFGKTMAGIAVVGVASTLVAADAAVNDHDKTENK